MRSGYLQKLTIIFLALVLVFMSGEAYAFANAGNKYVKIEKEQESIPANPAAGNKNKAVVRNQEQLKKALGLKEIKNIVIKSRSKKRIVIPKGDYRHISLKVYLPNGSLVNKGQFASISVESIKNGSWHEKAQGNTIKFNSRGGAVVVGATADISKLSIEKATKLDIKCEGKIAQIDVNGRSKLTLQNDGEITDVQLMSASELELKGSGSKLKLSVGENGAGSFVTSSLPVDMELFGKVSIVLQKGAEKSSISAGQKSFVSLTNNTAEKISVSVGKETLSIESGASSEKATSEVQYPEVTVGSSGTGAGTDAVPKNNTVALGERGPLMGAYYRIWKDEASENYKDEAQGDKTLVNNGGKNRMDEIPAEVDLAFVFNGYTVPESKFWTVLKNTYVPKLRAQGTKVIHTIGIRDVTGERGISKLCKEQNITDYAEIARRIVDGYVTQYDLDGLDIDLESHDEPMNDVKHHKGSPEDERAYMEQAVGVINEIGKIIGHASANPDKILILDTTIKAEVSRIFQRTSTVWDYVLVQKYGTSLGEQSVDSTKSNGQDVWEGFKKYGIRPEQMMFGFSFYEENGDLDNNIWADTVSLHKGESRENILKDYNAQTMGYTSRSKIIYTREPGTPTDSNAYLHAMYQFDDGIKGGIFSYAVDRDGVKEGIDATKQKCNVRPNGKISEQADFHGKWGDNSERQYHTEYIWTKELKKVLLSQTEYAPISESEFPDAALRNQVIGALSKNYRGNVTRFDGALRLSDPSIASLQGLNRMRVGKLSLENLTGITSLRAEELPASIKTTYEGMPYKKAEDRLSIKGLTAITELDLSGLELAHIPIEDVENMRQLKTVNLSNNRIDFADNGNNEDYRKLKLMYDIVTGNGGSIEFGNQRPQGYQPSVIRIETGSVPTLNASDLFTAGAETGNGTYMASSSEFDIYRAFKLQELGDKEFVDPSYSYADFTRVLDDSKRPDPSKTKVFNNLQAEITGQMPASGIAADREGTYRVTFTKRMRIEKIVDGLPIYVDDDVQLFEFKVIVGEEQEIMIKLTNNAQIIADSFESGPMTPSKDAFESKKHTLFDGNTYPKYTDSLKLFNDAVGKWFVFKIPEGAVVKRWTFYNAVSNMYGSPENTNEEGELQYLKDSVDKSNLTPEVLSNDDNWEKAGEFSNLLSSNSYSENVIGGEIRAAYWRYVIKKAKDEGMYTKIYLPEIELLGNMS